jgi:hypothetical protein
MSLSYNYPPEYAFPSAPPVYRSFPAPPRLHWGIVFVLSIVTIGIFGMIWMVVQANWVRKVTKNGKPFLLCMVYMLSVPVFFLLAFSGGLAFSIMHQQQALQTFTAVLDGVTRLGLFVLYIVAAYTLKGALEADPIDIPLGGIMTLFFGPTYFQYHLFDYSVEGKVAEQLSGFGEPAGSAMELPPQA